MVATQRATPLAVCSRGSCSSRSHRRKSTLRCVRGLMHAASVVDAHVWRMAACVSLGTWHSRVLCLYKCVCLCLYKCLYVYVLTS